MSHQTDTVRATADQLGGHSISFFCPGCGGQHSIKTGDGPGPRWGWNGDVVRPTFTPSVLVRSGHHVPAFANNGCWCTYYAEHPDEVRDFECGICHSFVADGRIQFLGDCTHALAGQTVDLPPFPEDI